MERADILPTLNFVPKKDIDATMLENCIDSAVKELAPPSKRMLQKMKPSTPPSILLSQRKTHLLSII